jgi:hypothetical protein
MELPQNAAHRLIKAAAPRAGKAAKAKVLSGAAGSAPRLLISQRIIVEIALTILRKIIIPPAKPAVVIAF